MKISPESQTFHDYTKTNAMASKIKPFPKNPSKKTFDAEYQTSLAAGKVHTLGLLILQKMQ